MNEKVQAYKTRLEKQLREVEGAISLKERSKSRILEKLKDVETSFSKELGRGAVKVSKIAGVEPVKKAKTVLKKNKDEAGKIETPTVEMNLPAAAVAPAHVPAAKKKSSWLNLFDE